MGDDSNEAKIREIERMNVTLEGLVAEVHELSGRRFPWIAVAMILSPFFIGLLSIGYQGLNQLNITSERTSQIQTSIKENKDSTQKEIDALKLRLNNLESKKN
jgi:hypothetical protein